MRIYESNDGDKIVAVVNRNARGVSIDRQSGIGLAALIGALPLYAADTHLRPVGEPLSVSASAREAAVAEWRRRFPHPGQWAYAFAWEGIAHDLAFPETGRDPWRLRRTGSARPWR